VEEKAPLPAPEKVEKTKEPWEMGKEEFTKADDPRGDYWGVSDVEAEAEVRFNKEKNRLYGKKTGEEILADADKFGKDFTHRVIVEQALKEGKPVPESVLAEYPELIAKEKPAPAPAEKAEEGPIEAKEVVEKPTYTPAQLKGLTVTTTAIREATGEKIKVQEDAGTALESAKQDLSEYQKLLDCLTG